VSKRIAPKHTAALNADSRVSSDNQTNKYFGPPYCRAEMYVGRVAC